MLVLSSWLVSWTRGEIFSYQSFCLQFLHTPSLGYGTVCFALCHFQKICIDCPSHGHYLLIILLITPSSVGTQPIVYASTKTCSTVSVDHELLTRKELVFPISLSLVPYQGLSL